MVAASLSNLQANNRRIEQMKISRPAVDMAAACTISCNVANRLREADPEGWNRVISSGCTLGKFWKSATELYDDTYSQPHVQQAIDRAINSNSN